MPACQNVYPEGTEPPGRRPPKGWRWFAALTASAAVDVTITIVTGNGGIGAVAVLPFIALLR